MSLSAAVKRSAKRVLRGRNRVLRTIGRLAPAGAVVLMYHRVSDDGKLAEITVSTKNFERQMSFLSENFHVVTVDEIVGGYIKVGKL